MNKVINFNKPFLTGRELDYIAEAVNSGHISGNGQFTKRCNAYFEERYGFKKALITSSCTDALEMCAILANIEPGDEVIIPSFTFVSTALAFVRQGAKIVFADSNSTEPNIDASKIESLITNKTKAIVPVHYAGVACDMDKIMNLSSKHNLIVIEDAAQAIESKYKGKQLGTIGHLSAFSFHETKNINSGEGGLLGINDIDFVKRAEIIWEKGTNRAEFFRGEVNKYGWVDTGSSFLPSEIVAAYLWAQLENIDKIQSRRIEIWKLYYKELIERIDQLKMLKLPIIPSYASCNGHIFYLLCESDTQRDSLIKYMKDNGVYTVFHYLSLHKSEYYKDKYKGSTLPNADYFSNHLVRLPIYYELTNNDVKMIVELISDFYLNYNCKVQN